MEFLERLRREKKLVKDFTKGLGKVAYHAACHLRAQKIGMPGARILGLVPDTEVDIVEKCSAVDGTWGMKAQHYEMGRKYAQKLARGIENAEPDARRHRLLALGAAHPARRTTSTPLHPMRGARGAAMAVEPSTEPRRSAVMKPIERGEILGLADYEAIREHFRARVIAGEEGAPRARSATHASCVFENRDTVLMQIQEMLRTERITREAAILHEIETYNELVPGDHELSATVLIEIDDKADREKFLVEAKGLDRAFALLVDGARCHGKHDESAREPRPHDGRPLPQVPARAGGRARAPRRAREDDEGPATSRSSSSSTHPRYSAKAALPASLVAEPRRGPRLMLSTTAPRALRGRRRRGHRLLRALLQLLPRRDGALLRRASPAATPASSCGRKVGFPAVHVTSDFTAPLRYGDVARIEGTVTKLGTTVVPLPLPRARARRTAPSSRRSSTCTCAPTSRR